MKRWKRTLVCAFATPLALAGFGATPAAAITDTCSEFTLSLNRLVSPVTGASLLSQYGSELASAVSFGYTQDEGLALKAAAGAGEDLVGIWRVYNPATRDFSWAAEGADLAQLQADGYTAQFRQFYASTVNNDCVSTAYRLSKGNKTRIAVGSTDRDALTSHGWAVASSGMFYAVPGAGVTPTPQPDPEPEPEPVPEPNPGADEFTVAVIPDTQQETWTDSDTRFKHRSTWLVANAAAQNLKFVTHVGDVVDWGNVAPAQFTRAKNGLSPLNGKIPYSLTVGNHDTGAVCAGGSACPGVNINVAVRDTTAFNAAFAESNFTNLRGQFEPGKVDNIYSTFTAAGEKWLVLNLELWPRQVAIDWAKQVVSSHADHNVIVATHSYLESDGSIGTSNGGYGATSPRHLYDNLIKLYPNIKVVASGHVGGGASRVDTGVNGNKIVSLLQTYHSRTTNPVRMLKVSVSKGTLTSWVYAPYTNETLAGQATTTGLDFDQ